MKYLTSILFLLILQGCISTDNEVREGGTDWSPSDIIGFSFKSFEESDPTEYRFYHDGGVVAILGVEDGSDTIAPLFKWKKEKRKLVILDESEILIVYEIIEITDSTAVFKNGEFTHRFIKRTIRQNKAVERNF